MQRAMLAASLLSAMCACSVHAQQMNRCQDAAGRTVYVDRECEVYGLRHIGTVQDRVTVAPAPASKDDRASAPSAAERGMQACRADAEKFCRSVKPGGGAIMDCLLDHQQEMSEECYEALKAKLHPRQ